MLHALVFWPIQLQFAVVMVYAAHQINAFVKLVIMALRALSQCVMECWPISLLQFVVVQVHVHNLIIVYVIVVMQELCAISLVAVVSSQMIQLFAQDMVPAHNLKLVNVTQTGREEIAKYLNALEF